MADVSIWGASYSNVPAITLPKTGGGTALFYDDTGSQTITSNNTYDVTGLAQVVVNVPNNWMGNNCDKLNFNPYVYQTTLDQTDFPTWTASTTATDMLAAQNIGGFVAATDYYDYIIEWLWCVDDAYLEGATLTAMPSRSFGAFYSVVHRRPYGLSNIETETPSYNYCTALYTSSVYTIYYNKSGNLSWTTSSYGAYCVNVVSTLSSTSSTSPTVTLMTPKITARCHSSYFATARKAYIDPKNTTIKMVGNIYRVDAGTSPLTNMYMNAVHLYSHPL